MDRLAMCMDLLADQKAAQALRLRYGVLDGKQRTLEQVSKALKPQVSIAQTHNLVRPVFCENLSFCLMCRLAQLVYAVLPH